MLYYMLHFISLNWQTAKIKHSKAILAALFLSIVDVYVI